ncbi:MAG TPA: tRNA uridine-5-carboxymethylaminomethyl(34) synthesis GTPase MnmE [Blastocatellia bacterium]|jgi:tRNA modification GTPase|nr:tRNA uridine-5-carboxymethylaminomethyl(34) synthesis GTPase MnmE [Blastocatellia bacterium]
MDTIVAVATPPGRSAIGVIRLSGPRALEILRTLTQEEQLKPEPNRVKLKQLLANNPAEILDYALVSFFESPHSFTGEDMVEISCHGSPVILRQLLDLIQSLDARLAGAGEFTLRACKNGKMNLSQAEAVRDLINAQTRAAAVQATRQLRGELSSALQPWKSDLIQVIVRLESAVEFVEDDLPQLQVEELTNRVRSVVAGVGELARTYASGHLLRDGIKVAIIGRPNVGKSSVFNRLVRWDRAIVTDVAGTTRDSITESISLRGVPVSITDTAGIREAEDKIEEIGVERTHRAIADADLLVVVVDNTSQLSPEDRAVLSQAAGATHIVAINKCDLVAAPGVSVELETQTKMVHVSALTGIGFEDLTAAIMEPFGAIDAESVGILVTDSRHYDLLRRTQASLESALELLADNAGEELVLVGLHNALRFLGEITGETTTEDILSEIFKTFCIGK